MAPRSILSHRLKYHTNSLILRNTASRLSARPQLIRTLATAPKLSSRPTTSSTSSSASSTPSPQKTPGQIDPPAEQKPARPQPWLTRKLRENPTALRAFLGLARVMGYGTKKQLAGRRALVMYQKLCVTRPEEDREFWQDGEWSSFT